MADGQQPNAVQLALQGIQLEQPFVIDADKLEPGRHLGRQQLPGHQVAVMLHLGEQDAVAGADVDAPPAVTDEVDRLGGVAGEDHFLG